MEFKLTKIAINKPLSVYLLVLVMVIIGWAAYSNMPREDFPDVTWSHLYVTIPYAGASSLDVESQISDKVEEELQDIDNLDEIKSTSTNSSVTFDLEFFEGYDEVQAKADIRDALEKVKPDLPEDGDEWIISDFNPTDRAILTVNISGDIGLFQLKEIAENVKDKFKSIPNIAEIKLIGGLEKEVQVLVDPNKLKYYNLDLNSVSRTIKGENKNIPGGSLEVGPSEYMIRIPGEIQSEREIDQMIIAYVNESPVYVKNVATVKFTFKDATNRSRLDGKASVSLDVKKQNGADMGAIADHVKSIVKKQQQKYGNTIRFSILGDQTVDINSMVESLENNIYTGIMFVVLVLLIFLGFRNALFVGLAIPLSMLLSFMVLSWIGITLNKIVLFSLIVSLGMLVDNAIVVVENIYRHLQSGKTKKQAAIDGVSEVVAPVFASTLTTLLAFFPILFMPNIIGDIFSYLPQTLLVTLTCSLVVGLFINPVICSNFMPSPKKAAVVDEITQVENSAFLMRYKKILNYSLRFPFITILIIVIFWVSMFLLYFNVANPDKKVEFFPNMEPSAAKIVVDTPDGVTLAYADHIVKEIENRIFYFKKDVESIISSVDKTGSTVILNFPTWDKWGEKKPTQIIKEIRQLLPEFSGARIRVEESGGKPPTGKDVQIEILGDDLNLIKKYAKKIEQKIKGIEGLVNLENDTESKRSEILIKIDKEKIARHGLNTSDVSSVLRMGLHGSQVSDYRIGKDEFDITVKLDKKFIQYEGDIENLSILTQSGESVSLSELAKIKKVQATGDIAHVDLTRVGTIKGDADGKRSGAVILKEVQKSIQPLIEEMALNGVTLQYAGADELQSETQSFLLKSFIVALLLIFVVLVTQFNSITLPFIILMSVFASFSGIFLGYSVHGIPLSVMVGGIGVIALAGIVVNNGIVLLDYIQQLRSRGIEMREAILLSGMVRLRPVLLTAVTTMLGMLPITLGMEINFYQWPFLIFGSESGTMWRPLNIAVLYGIGVATFLTLFLVPTLYYLNEQGKHYSVSLLAKVKLKMKR